MATTSYVFITLQKEVLDKEKAQLRVQLGFAKCMKYACIMYVQRHTRDPSKITMMR